MIGLFRVGRDFSAERSGMSASLVPVEDGFPIVLDKTILLIGRHPDCDAVLTDSQKISRKHCCIAKVNSHLVIRDLGSVNGVWVNGERIQRQSRIEIGDYVAIGDLQFQLQKTKKSKKATVSENKQSPQPDSRETGGQDIESHFSLNLSQSGPIPISEQAERFSVESSLQESDEPPPLNDHRDNAEMDDRQPRRRRSTRRKR